MKCQHDGCENEGCECTFTDLDVVVETSWYCGDHAHLHGFCPVCGEFWGGISSFEMNCYCDHCYDELQDDYDDYEDDSFDWDECQFWDE